MSSSVAIKGLDCSVMFAVDGVSQVGSWLKVKNFTATERGELVESDYIGEPVTEVDYRHDGWDLSWEIDVQDATAMDFLANISNRSINGEPNPEITVTLLYNFRATGVSIRSVVFYGVVMRPMEDNWSSRKDYVSTSFEAKAKRRVIRVIS